MTAIGVKQVGKTSTSRLRSRLFFETFVQVIIILNAGTAIVLSSMSVCDGIWLSSPGEQLFRVWGTCGKEACSPEMIQISKAMAVVRTTVSLGIVLAIFSLELLMVSQLCNDGNSQKKWCLGSVLLLVSFFLSSTGTLTYVFLLKDFAASSTFTMSFWCQCLGTFLFFFNGFSGLYVNHMKPEQRETRAAQP